MTDPGHVGKADVAPPPFINFRSQVGAGPIGGAPAPTWHPQTLRIAASSVGQIALLFGLPASLHCLVWRRQDLLLRGFPDLEAVGFRRVGDSLAELGGRRLQGSGELDDRCQARLTA